MTESSTSRSHLFTVRLWREEAGAGEAEYRGQVQHVLTGQLRHFRDWKTLVDFCLAHFEGSALEMLELDVDEEENRDDL